jgi:glycosyltransferase involved in cell wall biosynthesis
MLGIHVETLNLSLNKLPIKAFFKLISFLRKEKPDVVQTWMYHADLFGGIAARFAGIENVIWGIRASSLDPKSSKKFTRHIIKVLAVLSNIIPKVIVACASSALRIHGAIGYPTKKIIVIPNGYELTKFKKVPEWKKLARNKMNLSMTIPLIGSVGRFSSQKDYRNLFDALSILHKKNINYMCILVGTKLDSTNYELNRWISERKLHEKIKLLGCRDDIPFIMNSLDLHVLPSAFGEAFPNVVAEAMACGVPCIVTDVGDASSIVGDSGWTVPPREPEKLAQALEDALQSLKKPDWHKRCKAARFKIQKHFSIELMCNSYQKMWKKLKKI